MTYEAIVIGASAGGLKALETILSPLPNNYPLAIMIVQHRPPTQDELFASTLNNICPIQIKEADEKELIKPACVYIAPPNYHLLVEQNKTLSLSIDPKICYSRPAIDVLFKSAADAYQTKLIGIILTGSNNDGTAGLKRIKARGGLTIAQDPTTTYAQTMPRSAIEAQIIDKILSLSEITHFLKSIVSSSLYQRTDRN